MSNASRARIIKKDLMARRLEIIILAAIISLAAAIRIITSDYPMWLDEVASFELAGMPIRVLWSSWIIRETNPPLYYTVLHYWLFISHHCEWLMRIPNIVFSLIGILFAYLTAKAMDGKIVAGMLSAIFIALSMQDIYYSQQIRGYMLEHLFGIIMLYAFVMMAKSRDGNTKISIALMYWYVALYLLSAVGALYCHTTALLYVAISAAAGYVLIVLRDPDRNKSLIVWSSVHTVIFLAASWWISISASQVGTSHNLWWISKPSIGAGLSMMSDAYSPMQHSLFAWCIDAGCVVIIARQLLQKPDRYNFILLVMAIGMPAVLFLISQHTPIMVPKTINVGSAPAIILLARALSDIKRKWLSSAASIIIVISLTIQTLHWIPRRALERWDWLAHDQLVLGSDAFVFTDDEGAAIALKLYCEIVAHSSCPLRIRVIADNSHVDDWAVGLSGEPTISQDTARRLAGSVKAFSVIRRGVDNPNVIFLSAPGRPKIQHEVNYGWVTLSEWRSD